ncbi:hypothetical protein PpBr36_07941, partial [Pyricularia pennisetigena]|uniref:hypothetical protein n=1 Tax=Pyricularia pennisetigena TaxID=1578925 RepID=UPI001150F3A0
CKAYADSAYYAVENKDDLRKKYFKTSSLNHIKDLQDAFWGIEKGCDISRDNIGIQCEGEGADCPFGRVAFTIPSENKVYVCPQFFTYSLPSSARTLIHEMSHLDSSSVKNKPFGTLIITPGSPTMLIQTAVHPLKAAAFQIPAAVIQIQSFMCVLPTLVIHMQAAVIQFQSFLCVLPTLVIHMQAAAIQFQSFMCILPTLVVHMQAAAIHIPTLLPIMVAAVTQALMN